MKITLVTAITATLLASSAQAGTIERACLTAGRAADRGLCGCIQQVADQTLTKSDQRMAAKFFKDPQKAQDIRQSGNRSHEVFWKRYKAFGSTAQDYCS